MAAFIAEVACLGDRHMAFGADHNAKGARRPCFAIRRRNWGSVSRAFHWVLGLVVIGMLAYGWWMNHL